MDGAVVSKGSSLSLRGLMSHIQKDGITTRGHHWTEADSQAFMDRGDIVVPYRNVQIDTICSLIPARADETFSVLELAAGDGSLAEAVLNRFPKCRYWALDGSSAMRRKLQGALSPYSNRLEIRQFELEERRWLNDIPRRLRCVLASLIVHHADAEGKRRLFADLVARLEPGGAVVLADIVAPATPRVAELFARQWDASARTQSLQVTGNLEAYEFFRDDGWNYYDDEEPDPSDQPSRLVDQIDWLRDAGLKDVDVFWMHAGHAVFGGYA